MSVACNADGHGVEARRVDGLRRVWLEKAERCWCRFEGWGDVFVPPEGGFWVGLEAALSGQGGSRLACEAVEETLV